MAKDVFLSYAHDDSALALQVCGRLEAAGVSCWMAPRDILPWQDWGTAIIEGIEAANAIVAVLSEGQQSLQVCVSGGRAGSSERDPRDPFAD